VDASAYIEDALSSCQGLTRKSLSKPSMVAAMAAELGRDPRRSCTAADAGLLLRARLEVRVDKLCSISLSSSVPEP
jgi:hypothetical protein